MKKKIKLTAIVAVIIVFTFVGCKKYEDGPTFSLASKTSRLVRVWQVESASYTAVNITVALSDTLFSNKTYEFSKGGEFITTTTLSSGSTVKEIKTWAFDGSKESIVITKTSGSVSTSDTWEILRLTSKEFWTTYKDPVLGGLSETHYKAK